MLLPGPGVRQQKCVGGASGVECCRGLGVSGARIRGGLRTGQPLRWAAVCASGGERTRRAAAGRRGRAAVPLTSLMHFFFFIGER